MPLTKLDAVRNVRHKVFYGWYVVGGASISIFIYTAVIAFAPPLFLKPMSAELGWSRTTYFAVQTLGIAISGSIAPIIGRTIDRGNIRLFITVGSLVVGASLMAHSLINSFWHYLLLAGVIAPAGLALFSMAVFYAIISKWFIRKRGRALATAAAGVNIGGIVVPPFTVALVNFGGWRMAWVVMGPLVWAFMIPVALLTRSSPESIGLQPDGESQYKEPRNHSMNAATPLVLEREWTWPQLLRTETFWVITLACGLTAMASMGIAQHYFPFLTDQNISPSLAATMVSLISISGLAFRPLWAYVFERWHIRYAALLAFLSFAISILMTLLFTTTSGFYLASSVRGIASGGLTSLAPMFCGYYFGRKSSGEVLGLQQLVSVPFMASGAVFAAWAYDLAQDYILAFSMFTAMFVVCSVMVFLVRSLSVGTTLAKPLSGGEIQVIS